MGVRHEFPGDTRRRAMTQGRSKHAGRAGCWAIYGFDLLMDIISETILYMLYYTILYNTIIYAVLSSYCDLCQAILVAQKCLSSIIGSHLLTVYWFIESLSDILTEYRLHVFFLLAHLKSTKGKSADEKECPAAWKHALQQCSDLQSQRIHRSEASQIM